MIVSDIKLDPSNLFVSAFEVNEANLIIKRETDGQLELISTLPASGKAMASSQPINILMESVSLNKRKIEFVDYSVEPPVNLALQDIKASVQNSSLTDLFSIDFRGSHQAETNLKSEVNAKGDIDLKARSGEIDIDITNFELHQIAVYLGNEIKSGRLQLDTGIKMSQGHLVVKNHIHIKNVLSHSVIFA
ncbi:MAG: hypothetical protein ACI9CE_001260 [Flavobacterium sp.]|jgi:hypothetical protein